MGVEWTAPRGSKTKGTRGSAWEFRPESGTLGKGCDLPAPGLSSHFEATLMTLLLRDRCWGADVEAVRGQREVRNREDGREREQRIVADPKDAGKDGQGQKNQAEKESQGQMIKKKAEKGAGNNGAGEPRTRSHLLCSGLAGSASLSSSCSASHPPQEGGAWLSVTPPPPLTTTPPHLSGSFCSPAAVKGWNLSPSDASCLSSTAGARNFLRF